MHRRTSQLLLSIFLSILGTNVYAQFFGLSDCNSPVGNAISPGFYIGLMGGPMYVQGKTVSANLTNGGTTPATPTKNQAGGRLYVGYRFNTWATFEVGGTYFSTVNFHTQEPPCGRTKVTFGTGDIVLKLGVPVYIFQLQAIGGAAINYMINTSALNQDRTCDKSFNQYTFGATYGVGAMLAIGQNVSIDFSATHITVGALIGSANFYALGFSYHFVDVFCGQFLCD